MTNIKVTKEDGFECFSCLRAGKVVRITTCKESTSIKTMQLCHKCLSWLKNKLRGF